jgi:hypothetical protein
METTSMRRKYIGCQMVSIAIDFVGVGGLSVGRLSSFCTGDWENTQHGRQHAQNIDFEVDNGNNYF